MLRVAASGLLNMGRRRDVSLTVALCVSLVAHGGAVWTLIEGATREERARIRQGPVDRGLYAVGPIIVEKEELKKAEEKKPAPVKGGEKLPVMVEQARPPVVRPEPTMLKSVFGEADGVGDANHSAPGEQEMRAKREAPQVQAFLSKDPAGAGRVGDAPAQSTAPRGENGRQGPRGNAGAAGGGGAPKVALMSPLKPTPQVATPRVAEGERQQEKREKAEVTSKEKPEAGVAFGVPQEKVELVTPKVARKVPEPKAVVAVANAEGPKVREGSEGGRDAANVEGKEAKEKRQAAPEVKPEGGKKAEETPGKVLIALAPQVQPVVPSVVPSQTAGTEVSPPGQSGGGGKPGRNAPSADPAPMSDSESDAFGKVANVEFSNGRVQAQFGRRIKTVRPKLLLSAQYELFTQDNPRVLLSAKVDNTGRVTKVDIYQSSGTPDLDQPCLVAVYDWWFEPPKDKAGKPMEDVVVVAITFRTK